MATERDNEQRLRDAGMILTKDPLPQEYAEVFDGLTSDEVDVIIAVKKRLAAAERVSGQSPIHILFPP
jgi:hypothetical protein